MSFLSDPRFDRKLADTQLIPSNPTGAFSWQMWHHWKAEINKVFRGFQVCVCFYCQEEALQQTDNQPNTKFLIFPVVSINLVRRSHRTVVMVVTHHQSQEITSKRLARAIKARRLPVRAANSYGIWEKNLNSTRDSFGHFRLTLQHCCHLYWNKASELSCSQKHLVHLDTNTALHTFFCTGV